MPDEQNIRSQDELSQEGLEQVSRSFDPQAELPVDKVDAIGAQNQAPAQQSLVRFDSW